MFLRIGEERRINIMLIFVSDLHLTDQTLAPSVPLNALDYLLNLVKSNSKSRNDIHLILLGDIFDVLRSSRWLVKLSRDKWLDTPESASRCQASVIWYSN